MTADDNHNWLLKVSPWSTSPADQERLRATLTEIVASDPSLDLYIRPETGFIALRGMDEQHLEATIDLASRTCQIDHRGIAHVIYRQVVTRTASLSYTLKKQIGGTMMYAAVEFNVAPNEAGKGNTFETGIEARKLPTDYVAAVAKGVNKVFAFGALRPSPMMDVGVILVGGKYHHADSSVPAFEVAAEVGLRDAFTAAEPVVKEPIMTVEVVMPEEYVVEVMMDLSSRRAQIVGGGGRGDAQVVTAMVPLANMFGYFEHQIATTRGRATFTMHFDHYEIVAPDDDPRFRPAMAMRA